MDVEGYDVVLLVRLIEVSGSLRSTNLRLIGHFCPFAYANKLAAFGVKLGQRFVLEDPKITNFGYCIYSLFSHLVSFP